MYVLNAGHGKAFGVSYVRMVPIDSGISERRTDIYGHVRMGVFSGIGAPLMYRSAIVGVRAAAHRRPVSANPFVGMKYRHYLL